jgi:hypothetical protein
MSHAKTSFSTEILAGAIMSVVQYLAPLRYRMTVSREDWVKRQTRHICLIRHLSEQLLAVTTHLKSVEVHGSMPRDCMSYDESLWIHSRVA